VIAVDSNILVYAHQARSPHHATATRALRELDQDGRQWAVPWPCVHEFYAVITNPRIHRPPTPVHAALESVASLVDADNTILISETDRHWEVLRSLIADGRVVGGKVHDARIAAICLEHGVRELWSADRDFGRFPALKVVNPLVAQ
jgi:toxin-antitoxin system PIN domain toxin